MIKWYGSLPKWARFIWFYGTMPIWIIPALIIGLIFCIMSSLTETCVDAWEKFE